MVGALVIGGDYQGLGIIRGLGQRGIQIYLLDSGPCIGRVSKFTTKFFQCPAEEERMPEFLLTLAQKERVNGWVIYPTTDEMVRCLSIHRDMLSEHYKIPTPNWGITKLLYDKRMTYKVAKKLNISTPKTFYPEENMEVMEKKITHLPLQFPVIIKPATRGIFYKKTRKKALLAKNEADLLEKYLFTSTILPVSEIMIQEVIPGGPSNLYSFCSLFKDGVALFKLSARRPRQHPMDFGRASTFVEIVNIPELEELGVRFLSAVNYYGLSEVEFMWDPRDGCYKLIEVNPRTWGWHTIGNQIELDFSYLLYKNLTDTNDTPVNTGVGSIQGKWMRVLTDTPVALKEILARRLKIGKYLGQLIEKKEYAVWSLKDPLPFLLEFLLLPYLLKTRGY